MADAQKPCRSPYCECAEGQCTHPGCYDARGEQPEAVAVIGDTFSLLWASGDAISDIAKRHGLKVGSKLYATPQPPAQAQARGDEPVPGAVWEDGGVSLIRRGTEDARCKSRGSLRLYTRPAPAAPQAGEVDLADLCERIGRHLGASWIVIGPDGSRFLAETPLRAANEANKHRGRLIFDPAKAQELQAAIDQIRADSAAENDRLLAKYGYLNCPTCGGSGHVGDFEASQPMSREGMSQAARDVLSERRRQIEAEGWTPEHDDAHNNGELAEAAGCYALHHNDPGLKGAPAWWPWHAAWWKPGDQRRNLIKAGALILAELERLDRAHGIGSGSGEGVA